MLPFPSVSCWMSNALSASGLVKPYSPSVPSHTSSATKSLSYLCSQQTNEHVNDVYIFNQIYTSSWSCVLSICCHSPWSEQNQPLMYHIACSDLTCTCKLVSITSEQTQRSTHLQKMVIKVLFSSKILCGCLYGVTHHVSSTYAKSAHIHSFVLKKALLHL
jgi:hypothetical protein